MSRCHRHNTLRSRSTDCADGGLCTWRCLRLNRPNTQATGHGTDSHDHRCRPHCATSFRQGGGTGLFLSHLCTKLVNSRFTALVIHFLCFLRLFPFLLVETLSMEVCLLALFLSLCPCPCPGPWFCCLASSGFLSLALVPVLALARCLSPWGCVFAFMVHSVHEHQLSWVSGSFHLIRVTVRCK